MERWCVDMIPKFRAWDKAHEVMRNVLLIDFISRSIICETEDDRNIKLYDITYELMQSTGIKDNNGVEIYEGDIVENSHKEVGFIKNCSDAFCFNRQEWNFYLSGIGAGSPFEILGNVHQNPELLEVE